MNEITPVTWTQIKSQLERNTPLLLGEGKNVSIGNGGIIIEQGAQVDFDPDIVIKGRHSVEVGGYLTTVQGLTIDTLGYPDRILTIKGDTLATNAGEYTNLYITTKQSSPGGLGSTQINAQMSFECINDASSGSVSAINLLINAPASTSTYKPQNVYSLYVQKPTIGTSTNYSIYSQGDVYIGTKLEIGSTNLYPSAANILKTDDSFVAAGTTGNAVGASAGASSTTLIVSGAPSTYGLLLQPAMDSGSAGTGNALYIAPSAAAGTGVTVTNAVCMDVRAITKVGSGTVTNAWGALFRAQTIGGSLNYTAYFVAGTATTGSIIRIDGATGVAPSNTSTVQKWLSIALDGTTMYRIPCYT